MRGFLSRKSGEWNGGNGGIDIQLEESAVHRKDSTHTSKLPISVTAHSGIDSQKPQSSIVCIILCGRYVAPFPLRPEAAMIFDMTPCTMVNIAIIRSRPQVTAAFASTKRIKSFRACSGRLISWKELN